MFYEKLTENRKRFVNQLIPMIESTFGEQSDKNKIIKTISINASWGMGKTLLKDALYEKLKKKDINVITINAWETDYFNDPMKSLIGEISESNLNIPTGAIEKGEKLIGNIGSLATKIIGSLLLKKLNFTNEDITNIKSLLKGLNFSGIEDYKKYKKLIDGFKQSFNVGITTPKRVIIVDELDRCKPNYAIEMLESIKHIFDIFNLTFIFLINKEQLKETVKNLYGCELQNEDYFEKFFDVQLKFPKIDIKDFIKIEYDSYKYDKVNLVEGINLNFEKFMLSLFLKVLEKKYHDIEIQSIRQLQKSINKFNYLIKTFTEEEKRSFLLITGFIIYFIYQEFYKEIKEVKNIYGFDISNFYDDLFIDRHLTSGNQILNTNIYFNPKCYFEYIDINRFYSFENLLLEKKNIFIKSSLNSIFDLRVYRFEDITILCDKNTPNHENINIYLPLTTDFIKTHKLNSIQQWCKEKYEFTLYIE